ncbi:lipase family protein [Rhodococcus tukisamuensis]|uniref:Secretory lipase n=1 Tax=Rhodococcus tukisamuensis TaxID=168276 RepID=A0A1G6XLW8_9NOCA|nr:lipase family protein [Rhodococcus tukisamuensis]SDD79160.1 Secretory lipase [Rhodococcus tukisamuensis]
MAQVARPAAVSKSRPAAVSKSRLTTVVFAVLAVALTFLPAAHAQPTIPRPDPDPFYAAPPDLAGRGNGDVLRYRPVDVSRFGNADGWQILYRSTNSTGGPLAAVTTVMVPRGGVDGPLVSYQAIINSLGTECGPSHTLFNGQLQEAPTLRVLLARGWAVALPDHLGPYSAYGAARLGGQVTLDGIRAVQRLPEARLGRSPVGLTGYSGGGMATAWAGALAPTYAPELPIVGVAPGGVPANLNELATGLGTAPHPLFGLAFAATLGLEREYPSRMMVSADLSPAGMSLRDQIENDCSQEIIDAGANRSAAEVAKDPMQIESPLARSVFDENSVLFYGGAPRAPVHIWQGSGDVLAPVGSVATTVRNWCNAGTRVQFDVVPGDHGPAAIEGIPGAFGWLGDRFAGAPAPSNC